jgi:hypothetical protein
VDFRRGDIPEPLPPGWEVLGLHPAWRIERVPSRAEADRRCRELKVSAADEFNKRVIQACAAPGAKIVVLQEGAPIETEKHEFGHSWGLKHKNGRKWFTPDGAPAEPLSPIRAAMMLSMARAEARQAPASPTVAALLPLFTEDLAAPRR